MEKELEALRRQAAGLEKVEEEMAAVRRKLEEETQTLRDQVDP